MEIAIRDQQLRCVKREMKNNQKFILHKLLKLEKTHRENQFLKTIYRDYQQYHRYIVEQKTKQQRQLEMLMNYLEKTMLEAGLSDMMVRQATHEQQRILNELDEVRSELNELVQYKKSRLNSELQEK